MIVDELPSKSRHTVACPMNSSMCVEICRVMIMHFCVDMCTDMDM